MEQVAPQYRESMAFAETSASGIGIMTVSLIGVIFSNWIQYYLVLSTMMVACIPIIACMPRSFRWYFSKKYDFTYTSSN